jgi:peptidoglycan/LPS O-acetylase OafA/YrhL
LAELDSLRGLAALVVLFHHTLLVLPTFSDRVLHERPAANLLQAILFNPPFSLLWAGHNAVLLFFVLSGFVLATPWTKARSVSYAAFGVRRIFRIYVPYLVTVLAVLAGVALLRPGPIPALSEWFAGSWQEPADGRAVVDHVLMLGQRNFFDNPIWSLIWEMRVSLLFPLLILPIQRWGLAGSVALIVGLAGAYAGLSLLDLEAGRVYPFSATPFYALPFVLGATAAFQLDALRRWGARPLGPALALIVGLIILAESRWFPGRERMSDLAAMPGAALVICAVAASPAIARQLRGRLLLWLGRISYSLYLIHVPILLATVHLLYGRLPLGAVLGLAATLSLAAAALVHAILEGPSERIGRRLSGWIAPRPASSTAAPDLAPAARSARQGQQVQ